MVESALPELTHNWSVLVRADRSRAESPRFPSADNDALTTADWSVNVTCLALGQPSPGNLELGQKKAIVSLQEARSYHINPGASSLCVPTFSELPGGRGGRGKSLVWRDEEQEP